MTGLLLAILLGASPPSPVVAATPAHTTGRAVSGLGAAWRSTLVPGWGQRYKGQRTKGNVFTGIGAGLAAATAYTMMNALHAQNAAWDEDDPNADYDRLHEDSVEATIIFDATALLTAGFWIYNAADAGLGTYHPLRIRDARLDEVFPALQRSYQADGLVSVALENASDNPVSKVVVRLSVPDLLREPAEAPVVPVIPPGLGIPVRIPVAFDARLWKYAGTTPKEVPARLTIGYETGGQQREIVQTATLRVHGPNAIVWDDAARIGSFVTPRDERVRATATAALRTRPEKGLRDPLTTGMLLFDALSSGVVYASDPKVPFAFFDGNAGAVDHIAFPSETITRRTGDVDDLVAAYAALLESVGVPTAIIDVPGHLLVAFDSGMPADELRRIAGDDRVFEHDGRGWIPVETTCVGMSFDKAWGLGAVQVRKWSSLQQLTVVELSTAWSRFPPVALPNAPAPAVSAIDERAFLRLVQSDAAGIASLRAKAHEAALAAIRERKLPPAAEADAIGIALVREGELTLAEAKFREAVALDATSVRAWNNLASIAYLQGKPLDAMKHLEQAFALSETSGPVLVNFARIHYEIGDRAKAIAWFEKARAIDPLYARRHPELAALGDSNAPNGERESNADADAWSWEWAP